VKQTTGIIVNRIKPQRFVHVVYRTQRFDAMLKWYQTVFDAKIQFANPALAFLTYDDEHHRFAFVNLSVLQPDHVEPAGRRLIGVDHVAYTFGSLTDLFNNYEQLKELGILPFWCIHHGVTVSLYYADPDGNQMEFQVDSYPSIEETNAYMHSEHYSLNPIGVEFHPEEWLKLLRSGTPESELLVRQVDLPVSFVRGHGGPGGENSVAPYARPDA
jgi:catechol-2,3-dioxygenase